MGWATGQNVRGEDIGYAIEAVCEEPGCNEKIDKGLAYCCGGLDGVNEEWGCGHYFCGEHLFFGPATRQRRTASGGDSGGSLCGRCIDNECLCDLGYETGGYEHEADCPSYEPPVLASAGKEGA